MTEFIAVFSGLLLILVFPKAGLFLFAYVAIVPLLISIKRARSILEAAFCGAICGVIFFGGTLSWVTILSKWAGTWAYLAWASLAVAEGLYIAAFAGISKYVSWKLPKMDIITVPVIWTAVEWIRSLGPYGVTGGGLGYSQADFFIILQMVSITGIYGMTFLIVLMNESIAELFLEKKMMNLSLAILILTVALAFGNYRISMFKGSGRSLNIAIVQANISQDVKLDYTYAYRIVSAHEMMSRDSLSSKPDIVIWPETAVTTYLFDAHDILSRVKDLVAASRTAYLIGTSYRDHDKIYNSVVAFSRNGEICGRYDKQRLVPFGEYLPIRPLFYRLLQENPLFAQDYNSNSDPKIIDLGNVKVGAVICFESTFPYLVRDKVRKGAQFILVATNDAWFFDSAALYQHLQAAQVRAVENKMYVVQAANTGISAIIDPLGRIVKRSDVGQAYVLTGNIYVQ